MPVFDDRSSVHWDGGDEVKYECVRCGAPVTGEDIEILSVNVDGVSTIITTLSVNPVRGNMFDHEVLSAVVSSKVKTPYAGDPLVKVNHILVEGSSS